MEALNCSGKKRLLMAKPRITNKCIGSAIRQARSNRTSPTVCAWHTVEFRKKQRCIPSPSGTTEAGDLAFQSGGGAGVRGANQEPLWGEGAFGKKKPCVNIAGVEPTHSGPETDCAAGETPFNRAPSFQNIRASSRIESFL